MLVFWCDKLGGILHPVNLEQVKCNYVWKWIVELNPNYDVKLGSTKIKAKVVPGCVKSRDGCLSQEFLKLSPSYLKRNKLKSAFKYTWQVQSWLFLTKFYLFYFHSAISKEKGDNIDDVQR